MIREEIFGFPKAIHSPHEATSHFALAVKRKVVEFYKAASAADAKGNGAPGLRRHYHKRYYAAFVFDPDGYNIEAVFHQGKSNEGIRP